MSQQDLMCDVERLDRELHQQIQSKLEAWKERDTLQSKLTEMEQVISWCSESVWSMMRPDSGTQGRWFVLMNDSSHHYAPTLYAALKSAWEGRDK